MSDGNLLAMGCGVTFFAVAAFYVYLRDCWTRSEQATLVKKRSSQTLREN